MVTLTGRQRYRVYQPTKNSLLQLCVLQLEWDCELKDINGPSNYKLWADAQPEDITTHVIPTHRKTP